MGALEDGEELLRMGQKLQGLISTIGPMLEDVGRVMKAPAPGDLARKVALELVKRNGVDERHYPPGKIVRLALLVEREMEKQMAALIFEDLRAAPAAAAALERESASSDREP